MYDLDGRFKAVMPVKAEVGKRKHTSEIVGDIGIARKTMEAVTHWKLLGSSARPLLLISTHDLSLRWDVLSPLAPTDKSTGLTGKPRP